MTNPSTSGGFPYAQLGLNVNRPELEPSLTPGVCPSCKASLEFYAAVGQQADPGHSHGGSETKGGILFCANCGHEEEAEPDTVGCADSDIDL